MEIKIECPSCQATGLYCGFAEPKGVAVVCHNCLGTGCQTVSYKPFERRRRKHGIQHVMNNGSMWFTRTGNERTITAVEFYRHE